MIFTVCFHVKGVVLHWSEAVNYSILGRHLGTEECHLRFHDKTMHLMFSLNLKHIIHSTLYHLHDDDNMQAAYWVEPMRQNPQYWIFVLREWVYL